MNEAHQKMEALKKAYADIIFNTTKEAAAKIIVAERKAYRYHKETFETKEEAAHMLVRFKSMMDCKIAEMETLSFNQKRKIGELEAKVHKGEDVASNLRAELKEVKEELERLKSGRVQPLDKRNAKRSAPSEDKSEEIQLNTSKSIVLYPWDSGLGPLSSSNVKNACFHQKHTTTSENVSSRAKHRNSSLEDKCSSGKLDLSSIMSTIQKPQLYRPGCTQRIHAFERNQLNRELSPLHTETQSSKKNKICNMSVMKKSPPRLKELLQKANSWGKGEDAKFFKVPCRKRGTRSRKTRTTLCTNQIMKLPVGTTLLSGESSPSAVNCITKLSEDTSRESEETENNASVFTSTPVSPSNTAKMDIHSECPGDVQIDAEVVEYKSIENVVRVNQVLIDESQLTTLNNQDLDSSKVPEIMMKLKKAQLPAIDSDTKDDGKCEKTNRASTETVDDKFLKYTFQRKRKRTAFCSSGESESQENNTSEKRPSEMQSDGQEPHNSSLTEESSRDDRRLMLVARQLISLKDKKCWT